MKNGLIVYLVSGSEVPAEFDALAATRALGFLADRVELVSPEQGFFSVEDAWHYLLTQGCGRINLMVAKTDSPGGLNPLGPAVRLCG